MSFLFTGYSVMLKRFIVFLILIISPDIAWSQSQNCITAAAQCFQINPLLIRAIIWQESKNIQSAIMKNKNNTIDVGVMQINSINFKKFNTMGISEHDLRNNSCANVFAGTWILKQSTQRYGYSWDSVGRYHSSTPFHHDNYVKKIIDIIAYKLPLINSIHVESNNVMDKFKCVNR